MSARPVCWTLLVAFFLLGCTEDDDRSPSAYSYLQDLIDHNRSLRTINQGVFGTVSWWSGDFMPTIDGCGPSGTIEGYSDSVFVYSAFKFSDTLLFDGQFGTFLNVTAPLFGKTLSTSTGFYQISLPPGDYTILFRVSGDTLWGGYGAGDGSVMKVTIQESVATEFDCGITLNAYF